MTQPPAGLIHNQAKQYDAAELKTVTRAAYAEWAVLLGRDPLPMIADYNEALKIHRFDTLRKSGIICALIETELREDSLWIENIAILPRFQGQGIGRWFLNLAQDLAREANLYKLTLYTNAKMERNIRIYKKYGFQVEKEEIVEHGIVVHMFMNLTV